MKTEIYSVIDVNSEEVYKSITITTDNDETIFHGKLYADSGRYKEPIDEEKLLREIESIPNLIKNK